MTREIREAIADAQHAIWAHWMRYQFSVCVKVADGSIAIPADKVGRWTRQMETDYADLTEREKDSDREQADKVLAAVGPMAGRVAELEAALCALYDATKDVDDRVVSDGDGGFDIWQTDELGAALEKARKALGREKATWA